MSGGHWNYAGSKVESLLREVAEDGEVLRRWPLCADTLSELANWVYQTEHDMDWDVSGDEWFPRGKWATIQAVQDRAEHGP